MPRPTAASRVMPIDWSTRPISSMATHRLVKSPSRAAVLLRRVQPEQAELTHLLDHVDREVVVVVPLGGVRGDLLLGEVAHGAAELLVVLGQVEGHGGILAPKLTIDNPRGGKPSHRRTTVVR